MPKLETPQRGAIRLTKVMAIAHSDKTQVVNLKAPSLVPKNSIIRGNWHNTEQIDLVYCRKRKNRNTATASVLANFNTLW